MMEADRLLAERLQSKEREDLTDKEKAKLFMELMEKRRKLLLHSGHKEKRTDLYQSIKRTQNEKKRKKRKKVEEENSYRLAERRCWKKRAV
ncbi:hypothetical protein Tco_0156516 [Tanacetum coccineum]